MQNHLYRVNLPMGFEPLTEDIGQGWLQSYGVFTTFLASPNQSIFRLEAHHARLKRDCQYFNIHFPWHSMADFETFLYAFLQQELHETQVVRLTVTGEGTLQENHQTLSCTIFVSLRPLPKIPKEVNACTFQFERLFPQHKHMNHIAEGVYLQQAQKNGYSDFIRISQAGYLAEAAYANLFLVMPDDTLMTPSFEAVGCLPGIVREAILKSSQALDLCVEEGLYTIAHLKAAKGIFLTNAVKGVYAIHKIDQFEYDGPAIQPILEKIRCCLLPQNMISP